LFAAFISYRQISDIIVRVKETCAALPSALENSDVVITMFLDPGVSECPIQRAHKKSDIRKSFSKGILIA
jgi:hypothetical protein